MRKIIRYAVAASLFAAGALAVSSVAQASDCAQRCYAQENSCRRATQDSPRCGAELTRCLQSCRR